MNIRRFLIAPALVGILLVSTSCSNPFAPTTSSDEAAAAVEPEVKTAVEAFLGKYNAHEGEGAGEHLADDPGFQWIEDGRTVYDTRTAAVAGLTAFFSGFSGSRLEAYDIKVVMLSDEAAVASFRYAQTIAAGGGQAALKGEGAMSLSMTQRDGSWKILVAHKSASAFPR